MGASNVRPPRATFRFDEVVAERPTGAASLDALFLVSPRDGEPEVSWRREAITVRPRRGFRSNTVYTITMLPGLADLRGNVRKEGAEVVFSTGATLPRTRLTGVVFDWPAGAAAPRAFVQAIAVARRPAARRGAREAVDSTVYVTVADSTGQFVFRYLPPGTYTVRGAVDANNNRSLDPREAYDSALVTLRDSGAVELLAFVHDTVGPRLTAASAADSVTVRATFDQPLLPSQPLTPALFLLVAPDSSRVPIRSVAGAREADSAAAAAAPRDTAAAPPARDTTPAVARAAPSRPRPVTEVVIRLGQPLRAGTTYRLEARGARNLLGRARTSDRPVQRAAAAPAGPPAAAPARPGQRPPARPPAAPPRRPR